MSAHLPRVVMGAMLVTIAALHGLVAWLAPVQGDDWGHLMWWANYGHLDDGARALAFAREHFTLGDLAGFALAKAPWLHAVLTPIASVAVIVGTFAIAARRLPRATWDDVLAVAVVSALIWLAAPRAGLVYFYRPYAAGWLYGTALTLWFLAPYRCGFRPRGAWLGAFVLAGFFAGTSTRQLGTLAVIAAVYAIRRTPQAARARWMWAGLVAVVAGTVVGYLDVPRFDFRGFKPGFERTMDALNLPLNEGGELISLVAGLVMVRLVWDHLRRPAAPAGTPDTSETLRWIGIWFGFFVFTMFGPRYSEASLFPAAVLLCVGAFPYVRWLASSRVLRGILIAIAVGVPLVVWTLAVSTYLAMAGEYRERMDTLARAPHGSVAVIRPYSKVLPSFFFFGEDWAGTSRQHYAIRLFDLQDIDFSPPFRRQERNPNLPIRFESERLTDAQLRAAGAPARWATDVTAARAQFDALTRVLEAQLGEAFSARLVIDIEFAGRAARPVYAAWYEDGTLTSPRVRRAPADNLNRHAVRIPPSLAAKLSEVYVVNEGRTIPSTIEKGRVWIQPMTTDLFVTIICDPRRCLVADAFVPRF